MISLIATFNMTNDLNSIFVVKKQSRMNGPVYAVLMKKWILLSELIHSIPSWCTWFWWWNSTRMKLCWRTWTIPGSFWTFGHEFGDCSLWSRFFFQVIFLLPGDGQSSKWSFFFQVMVKHVTNEERFSPLGPNTLVSIFQGSRWTLEETSLETFPTLIKASEWAGSVSASTRFCNDEIFPLFTVSKLVSLFCVTLSLVTI